MPGIARAGQEVARRVFSASPSQLLEEFWPQLGIWGFRARQAAASGFAGEMAAGAMGGHIPAGLRRGSAASPLGKGQFLAGKGVSRGLESHVSPHPPESRGRDSLPIPTAGRAQGSPRAFLEVSAA